MININGYDMIYSERVYKCVDMKLEFSENGPIKEEQTHSKPKFLHVVCIDENGEVIVLRDETWCFRFIRKGRDKNDN